MRVIDKRMFNADGELRDDVRKELEELAKNPPPPAPEPAPAAAPPAAAKNAPAAAPTAQEPVAPAADDEDAVATGPTDPHFVRLVMTLSNQAGLFLGLLVDPLNPGGSTDLPTAKTFIDMLASLDAKTRGQLNEEEAQLLESVLYELKMAYVEKSRKPQRG